MAEDIASYVRLQKELLSLEREAEKNEAAQAGSGAKVAALESAGLALTRLSVCGQASDAGGRQIVTFRPRAANRRLSAAGISAGDIVGVRPHTHGFTPAEQIVEGVVTAFDEASIAVCVDEALQEDVDSSTGFFLIKLSPDVTHTRYTRALSALEAASSDPTHVAYGLLGVLLGGHPPRFQETDHEPSSSLYSELNGYQEEAVHLALRAVDLAVVHGPPGTGKTHTIASYIAAEVKRGNRVLVVAPSNVAVDNVAERLAARGDLPRFVRAGHPARIIPSVQPYALDAMLARAEQAALARDVRQELDHVEGRIVKTRDRAERKALRLEQRGLRKELRKREALAMRRMLAKMDVVLATISGAGARVLDLAEDIAPFDVVVIDEAGQALEAACWGPLLRARKAVLAGDPYQLAGTVKSMDAEARGLKRSILDRIFSTPALETAVIMLETQYRMNNIISQWSSNEFYEGKLKAHASVADHRVSDLETYTARLDDDQNFVNPFIVIDTVGGDCEEEGISEEIRQDPDARTSSAAAASRSNKGEANIVCLVVDQFVNGGVRKQDIAVISPYAGQVELLRQSIWPRHGRLVEIATVDSFQGREKEVVCISLVRSNEAGDVGFLRDERRLNVAITRARRGVVVVLDSETVSTQPLLLRLVEYAERCGHYRSAVTDFPDIVGTFSAQRRPKEAIEAEKRSSSGLKRSRQKRKGPIDSTKPPAQREPSGSDRTGKLTGQSETHFERPPSELRIRLQKEIHAFVTGDGETERTFPVDLSSHERRIVHELAEELGLGHATNQVGESRRIKVWKKGARSVELGTSSGPGLSALHNENAHSNTNTDSCSDVAGSEAEAAVGNQTACLSREQEVSLPSSTEVFANGEDGETAEREEGEDVRDERAVKDGSLGGLAAVNGGQQRSKGSRRRKRKGKARKADFDSDEEFEAALAKYGAPQSSRGTQGRPDLVQQIINGQHLDKIRAQPKINKEAKQRLAAKISHENEKRSRKPKKDAK